MDIDLIKVFEDKVFDKNTHQQNGTGSDRVNWTLRLVFFNSLMVAFKRIELLKWLQVKRGERSNRIGILHKAFFTCLQNLSLSEGLLRSLFYLLLLICCLLFAWMQSQFRWLFIRIIRSGHLENVPMHMVLPIFFVKTGEV